MLPRGQVAADMDETSLECPDQVCALSSASMPPARTPRSQEQSDPTRKRPLLRRVRVPRTPNGGTRTKGVAPAHMSGGHPFNQHSTDA